MQSEIFFPQLCEIDAVLILNEQIEKLRSEMRQCAELVELVELETEARVLDPRARILNPLPHILQVLKTRMENVGEGPSPVVNTGVLKLDKR